MNETNHERRQEEAAATQKWAMDALRFHFDVIHAEDINAINGGVFKFTRCGAWAAVDKQGEIVFGSAVEGSDAEFECEPIATEERTQEEISADIDEALQWLEAETDAAWQGTNG